MKTEELIEQFEHVCSILGYQLSDEEFKGVGHSLDLVPMFRCVIETFVLVMRPVVVSRAALVHSFEDGTQVPLDILQTVKNILAAGGVNHASLEDDVIEDGYQSAACGTKPSKVLH